MADQDTPRIDRNLFFRIVGEELASPLDLEELRPIVEPGHTRSMQTNAGAGTGKTTALTAKCLYAVYVEGLSPDSVLATTFTRKAARELQSRILSLGEEVVEIARNHVPANACQALRFIDLNAIVTGTLDSIVQETLQSVKEPLDPPPLPIEEFVAKGVLLKSGLFPQGRFRSEELQDYIKRAVGPRPWGWTKTRWLVESVYSLRAHCIVNDVRINDYLAEQEHPGARIAFDAVSDFSHELQERRLADFLTFNELFLRRLQGGLLNNFVSRLRLVLVDEYQDTEHLQERIYFELAKTVLQSGGALVVVGDDDQALYRFRHATVGLFVNFRERLRAALEEGLEISQTYLSINRRSTASIVRYCNDFLLFDSGYNDARTTKPEMSPQPEAQEGDPVLLVQEAGEDAAVLAARVAEMVSRVCVDGWQEEPLQDSIRICSERGSPGDIAVIAQSVRETDSTGTTFIGHLRRELDRLGHPKLFNPRGRDLSDVPEVVQILGLLMCAMDPHDAACPANLPSDVRGKLADWRSAVQRNEEDDTEAPSHTTPGIALGRYIGSFRHVRPKKPGEKRSIVVSEVLYRLATWIPFFQDDIEGLAYLELLQRSLSQAQVLGKWGCKLVYDDQGLITASVVEMYWNFLVPLAAGDVDIDEDLLVTLPRDRIHALTVHQAKGLEYPLVIVDVGSRIKNRHSRQFYRWPDRDLDQQNRLHAEFEGFAGYRETRRDPRDERFDELLRKFFVAFSRAGQVLVLVAHRGGLERRVENVAVWFDRDGTWSDQFYQHVRALTE